MAPAPWSSAALDQVCRELPRVIRGLRKLDRVTAERRLDDVLAGLRKLAWAVIEDREPSGEIPLVKDVKKNA